MLCCVPGWLSAPRRCALLRPALCCFVPCHVASLVGCRCLLCCAFRRCPSPWGPVSSGTVFCAVPPRTVLSAVSVLPWYVGVCCCLPLCCVLCVCAVCVLRCRASRSLSSSLCAVLCCAVLVRLRCAVRVICPVCGAWCCGPLPCAVLFPVVFCCAVPGLVARGGPLVACFGVGAPVWPRGLLLCGWCGLLWCPAPLCCVLWCCVVVWCCAACSAVSLRYCLCLLLLLLCPVVLCCPVVPCRWAVMFVIVCCVCLSSFENVFEKKF